MTGIIQFRTLPFPSTVPDENHNRIKIRKQFWSSELDGQDGFFLGREASFGIAAFGLYCWWVDFGLSLLASTPSIGNGAGLLAVTLVALAPLAGGVASHFPCTF